MRFPPEAPLPPTLRTVARMLAVAAIAGLVPALIPPAAAAEPPPAKAAEPAKAAKATKPKPSRQKTPASAKGLPPPEATSVLEQALVHPDADAADPGNEEAPPEADSPWDAAAAAYPELTEALARHADPADPESADALAAVLLAADPRLVALLLPIEPQGPYPDRTGEDARVDLVAADLRLEGTHLVGWVQGEGVVENGVWLELDTRGGPAPDLALGFGRGWSREATLDGGGPSPFLMRDVTPEIGDDWLSFDVDLAGSARFDPAHAGAVTASVKSFDGFVTDVGPGGFLGAPPEDALDVFVALVTAGPVADADLAVALAITFGTVRAQVADGVTATVDADALAWLRYGEGLDAWLTEHGASWRFSDLDGFAKLVWAWPAGQTVAYGAMAMATQAAPLTEARYRFVVPSVEVLISLRDHAPMQPTAALTADAIDAALWRGMAYRTNDDLMRTLCSGGVVDAETCKAWRTETIHTVNLGTIDGVTIGSSEGVSAALQLKLHEERGRYVGDCSVATSLAIWQLQALGIPAIGMGWAGSDTATPTHDVPLWLDGDTFRATQAGPSRDWASEAAFVYVTLPGVHPVNTFTLAQEPNGWSRGGAVAGGWTKFAEVRRILSSGLPASVVGEWVSVEAAGGWPTW